MSNTAENLDIPSTTDSDGLDGLFEAEVLPSNSTETPSNTRESDEGVTVQIAAKQLGLSVKTIKDRLRKGTLKGFKATSKFGKVWMVDPCEVGSADSVQLGHSVESLPSTPVPDMLGSPTSSTYNIDRLLDQIEKKDRELQAAVYRNGYLESQLETAKTEIKLLPDLQSRAAQLEIRNKEIEDLRTELTTLKQSKWTRFLRWFIGR